MNPLRSYRRHLNVKKLRTAMMLAKMQKVEPDMKRLKDPARFEQVFSQVFEPKQTSVETFEPKPVT